MLLKASSLLFYLLLFSSFAIDDSEGGFFGRIWKGIKRVGKGIWNGIKSAGRFLAKNGNVLSAATALIPGVGPAISSGIQIASKVGQVLFSTDKLKTQSKAVSRSAGDVQHAATLYALNPTSSQLQNLQQSIQAMAAHGPTLNKIDFNTDKILSTSQKSFERAGQVLSNQATTHAGLKELKTDTRSILGAQEITNGFLREIDSDLTQVQKSVNIISDKVDISNAKLGELLEYSSRILDKLDSVENNVLEKIVKLSREVQTSFQNLNSVLNKGFSTISRKLTELSREMRDGLNELDQEIEEIGETLRRGIAAILQGQLEQDSKLARECYRSLMDEMNRNDGLKSNYEILMNVNELSSLEKRRLQELIGRLEDPENGVDACRAHFRAIYDPAGSPFPAGDVFQKLKDKFLFLHPERKGWSSAEAVGELKSLNQMGNQFLLHLINLFSLKTLSFAPKLSNISEDGQNQDLDRNHESENDIDQNEALSAFLLDSEEILEAFEGSFPLCPPSHALLEAVETRRLYCDEDPVIEENAWPLSSWRVQGFPVGAVCTFECYGRRQFDPIVCGPGGVWSQADRNIAANLLNCTQAIGDVSIINQVLTRVVRDVGRLNEDVGQLNDVLVPDAPLACEKIKSIYQSAHDSSDVVTDCTGRLGNLYWKVNTLLSWADARSECQRVAGADLMSIHNFEENNIATELGSFWGRENNVSNSYPGIWLGMHRKDMDCSKPMEWTDGTPVNYSNFNKGNPDCWKKNQHCVYIWFRSVKRTEQSFSVALLWDDGRCTIRLSSVCQVQRQKLK